ncbi:MAG: hypothetical protein WCK42_07270 [Myxococcaceae bacterium]
MKIFFFLLGLCSNLMAENWFKLDFSVEGGFSALASHQYQSGNQGTRYNFIKQGNQNVLVPFWRSSLGLLIHERHLLEMTYQPIFLDTQAVANQDLIFDDVKIGDKQPYKTRYYFPFYRIAYFYKIINKPFCLWSAGGGLQMRSATISFIEDDGGKGFVQNNIGPVPLIVTRFRYDFENHLFVGIDAAGFWAPIPIANGSDKKTTGWIYDVALQGGIKARDWLDVYLSARLIGGGADGDGSARISGDRYTYNSLNLLNFSTGLIFKL